MNHQKMTATDVGRLYGISRQSVGLWFKAGCPRNPDATYNLGEVIRWREAQIREECEADGVEHDEELQREKLRKLKAEADMAEHKRDQQRGDFLPRQEVEEGRIARIREVKRSLLNVPRGVSARCAVMTSSAEIETLLLDRLEAVCNQFSRGGSDDEPE